MCSIESGRERIHGLLIFAQVGVGIAEIAERYSFSGTVPNPPMKGDCLVLQLNRFSVVTHLTIGDCHVVEYARLAPLVVQLAAKGRSPLKVTQALLPVA